MSTQTALQFIATVREDPELVRRIQELGHSATIDRLVALGKASGLDFTTDELRTAYKHDWAMRLARYASGERSESPE